MKIKFAETFAGINVPFRIALSTIIAVMLMGTVALVGVLSYSNLVKSAGNLSEQVLDQTSLRINQWVGDLLSRAHDQNELTRSQLGAIRLTPDALTRIARYWQRIMESQPSFTFLSVGLETGRLLAIERLPEGGFSVREARIDRKDHLVEISDFWPQDYAGRKSYDHKKIRTPAEPSMPPWYVQAREMAGPVWTEARTLRMGARTVPGVTYAAPIYTGGGKLLGVSTVNFDISSISRFLAANPVGKAGYAFIVEKTAAGGFRVIAHPDPEILTRSVTDERGRILYEFVPFQNLKDDRVARFVEHLSAAGRQNSAGSLQTFTFTSNGAEYFGSYRKITGKDLPGWLVALIIPRNEIMGPVDRNNLETLGIAAAGLFLILLASAWISARISKPLGKIARDSEAVGHFELAIQPRDHSVIREVERLMAATHDMKRGLRSFQKYVPADLVREILASGQEAELGGRRETLTVFFSDLEGFTSISERFPPESLVDQLAEYFEAMSREIRQQPAGTVDKFIGDSIMAFWGAPLPNPDHAPTACRAALRCQERLAELRGKWVREGKPAFFQRIGIDTGEVIVGNMGSATRMNYTAVGETVNLASRFESLNRYYGTRIMIGEGTYNLVESEFAARPLDLVSVMGSTKGVRIYELAGEKKDLDARRLLIVKLSAAGLESYLERRWSEAGESYRRILELDPEDQPAKIMIARCRLYLEKPPPGDWIGIYRVESK